MRKDISIEGDLMLKKRGFVVVLFLFLLSVSAFAQDFGFDFQFGKRSAPSRGYGTGSGVSNAISSALDIVFGGILGPFFDAIRFNFYSAVKLALIIVLYLVFSTVFKTFFGSKGMHPKFAKVIGAILALFSVVFIPESLLDLVFRDLLSGFVGYLLLAAVVALPLYYLFKWSRDNKDDRAVNLVSAFLFFALIIVFSELHNQFVYTFNYGFVQTLTSLTITFGIIFALVLFVHRLYMGFKGREGEEREEKKEKPKEDRFRDAKSVAQHIIGQLDRFGGHIDNLSDDPNALVHQLTRNPRALHFINRTDLTNINTGIHKLDAELDENKKTELAAEIIQKYNDFHDSVERFRDVRRGLEGHLANAKAGNIDIGFFSDLMDRIEEMNNEIKVLVKSLMKVGRL